MSKTLPPVKSEFCCDTPNKTAAHEINWRNRNVLAAFSEFDPQWHHHVGLVRMFDRTIELCDLRLETSKEKATDCTHFVYTPTIFEMMWYEMYRGFYHLVHRKYTI